jgi:quercetin dioxygenase-like cupin family protein
MPEQPRIVPPGEGPIIDVVGDRYRFLAVGEQTGGRYAMWHATVMPGGGPPPHVHEREVENFYVLRGEVTFTIDGRRVVAGPGTSASMPIGVPHAFKNESGGVVEMILTVVPAGLEGMFRRTGVLVTDPTTPIAPPGHDEIERLLAVAPEYGVRILV